MDGRLLSVDNGLLTVDYMMKPALQKSAIPENRAFVVKSLTDLHFDPNWHFHPEYQLFVVLAGTGTRFIGDHVAHFSAGDLVFIGPDLPHLWRSDDAYFERNGGLVTQGIVVYFQENLLGDTLLHTEEMSAIRQLFGRARRGLEITGKTRQDIIRRMQELLHQKGVPSVIQLLHMLDILARSPDCQAIASLGYTNTATETDQARMNHVYAYVTQHFRRTIRLEEVAALASLTPTSFSRYFKARANKSFSGFVRELRIGYACKLLQEDALNIAQICYECGFKTLSNFNKQFKESTGVSPLQYKGAYRKVM